MKKNSKNSLHELCIIDRGNFIVNKIKYHFTYNKINENIPLT